MFGVKVPSEGYVDMHCHIVPGVDDGAKDMDTAIEMVKMAYADGIRQMIATPHFHPDKVYGSEEEVYGRFLEFRDEAAKVVPDMKFYFGREIYCDYDAVDILSRAATKGLDDADSKCGAGDECDAKYKTMCGTSYVLVEFDVNANYPYMKNQLQRIMMQGYVPVVAHIERYECLVSHPERVEELKDMNMVLQVNAMSVTGKTGKITQKFVLRAMKDGLVDLVASDAHTTRNRCPKLMEAAKMVGKKCGRAAVERMFIDNPRKIIAGENVD